MSDFLDELSGSTIGGIQTDHGGITIGDVLVLILDFVLLIYTGWRSYDFLSTTVPSGWEMLALNPKPPKDKPFKKKMIIILKLSLNQLLHNYIKE